MAAENALILASYLKFSARIPGEALFVVGSAPLDGRLQHQRLLDRMAARLAARPKVLDQRRTCVEHPFGLIKQWMHQGAFLMRRLENVRGEFSLTALACNFRRAISLVGVPSLIAAAKA